MFCLCDESIITRSLFVQKSQHASVSIAPEKSLALRCKNRYIVRLCYRQNARSEEQFDFIFIDEFSLKTINCTNFKNSRFDPLSCGLMDLI